MAHKAFFLEFFQSGTVGKRYRRQDEVGTPYCITVDYETIHETKEDGSPNPDFGTVTLRFRDSMKQERVKISELRGFIHNAIANYKPVVR